MIFNGKKTYTEFSKSDEKIATDILSNRLTKLNSLGIITKEKLDGNKKVNIYNLTQKGIELLPILLEMSIWSDNHLNEHLKDEAKSFVNTFKSNKYLFIRNKYSLFKKK